MRPAPVSTARRSVELLGLAGGCHRFFAAAHADQSVRHRQPVMIGAGEARLSVNEIGEPKFQCRRPLCTCAPWRFRERDVRCQVLAVYSGRWQTKFAASSILPDPL
jgi:hypothetical protein